MNRKQKLVLLRELTERNERRGRKRGPFPSGIDPGEEEEEGALEALPS